MEKERDLTQGSRTDAMPDDADDPRRGYHDIGGKRIGGLAPLSTASAPPPAWATLTDALRSALGNRYRISEQRRKIEELGPAVYDSTSYYEVRVLAMREILLEKGLTTAEEIDRRMADIRDRRPTPDDVTTGGAT